MFIQNLDLFITRDCISVRSEELEEPVDFTLVLNPENTFGCVNLSFYDFRDPSECIIFNSDPRFCKCVLKDGDGCNGAHEPFFHTLEKKTREFKVTGNLPSEFFPPSLWKKLVYVNLSLFTHNEIHSHIHPETPVERNNMHEFSTL